MCESTHKRGIQTSFPMLLTCIWSSLLTIKLKVKNPNIKRKRFLRRHGKGWMYFTRVIFVYIGDINHLSGYFLHRYETWGYVNCYWNMDGFIEIGGGGCSYVCIRKKSVSFMWWMVSWSIVDLQATCGRLSDAYKLFEGLRSLKVGVDHMVVHDGMFIHAGIMNRDIQNDLYNALIWVTHEGVGKDNHLLSIILYFVADMVFLN